MDHDFYSFFTLQLIKIKHLEGVYTQWEYIYHFPLEICNVKFDLSPENNILNDDDIDCDMSPIVFITQEKLHF